MGAKYKVGQLVLAEDEEYPPNLIIGTICRAKLYSHLSSENVTIHYEIIWSDGYEDDEGNLFPESRVDEYVANLEKTLEGLNGRSSQ